MVERYCRPVSIDEAVRLRAAGPSAYLGGGTTLSSGGTPEVPVVISLDGLGLGFVREESAAIVLGASLSLQEVADCAPLAGAGLSVLADAARAIGNRSFRGQSTVGGHVAANRSGADLVPALVVLEARVLLATVTGEREVGIEAYVAGPAAEALVTGVRVPRPAAAARFARERFARTSTDGATMNVAIGLHIEGSTITAPRLAVGGVARTVVRLAGAEAALEGAHGAPNDVDALGRRLADAVRAEVRPVDDLRGSAAFKTRLAAELAARALVGALSARGGAR